VAAEAARTKAIAAGTLTIADPDALPPVSIERPARAEHGDYATNAAMQLAPRARMAPMRIAEALVAALELPEGMGSAEVAPPGFINIRLDPAWVAAQLRRSCAPDRHTVTCRPISPDRSTSSS